MRELCDEVSLVAFARPGKRHLCVTVMPAREVRVSLLRVLGVLVPDINKIGPARGLGGEAEREVSANTWIFMFLKGLRGGGRERKV